MTVEDIQDYIDEQLDICIIAETRYRLKNIKKMLDQLDDRPKGSWCNDIRYSGWTCTNCLYHDGNKTDEYCPHCGAKMESYKREE